MSLLQGLKWYYEAFGIRGVLSVGIFRIAGRPRELAIIPPHSSHPVFLRIDTSDFCSYRDVLAVRSKSYEPPFPGFSPKIIVDVGAHIGMASILFALVYPEARIIAIEPEDHNYAALIRNTRHYRSITTIQAALWHRDGKVNLGTSDAHPRGAFRVVEHGVQQVRSMTMNTIMREARIDSIDLLKVDIEGAEKEVFESCPWIQSVQTIAIELHDRIRPGCSSAIEAVTPEFRSTRKEEITFLTRFHASQVGHDSTDPSTDKLTLRSSTS